MNDAMRKRCGRARSSAKRKAGADPRPSKKRRFGLSFAALFVAWSLFVLLNSCITDSEDELGLLTSEDKSLAFDYQRGPVCEDRQSASHNIDTLWDNCREHEVYQNVQEFSSAPFSLENAVSEDISVKEKIDSGNGREIDETLIEDHPVPGEESISLVCNLESTGTDEDEDVRQSISGNGLVISDENVTEPVGEGGLSQKEQGKSSTLDLQKKAGWLLRVEERAGSAKYFSVEQPESGQCDLRNSKGEVAGQRCLVSMPTESDNNDDFTSYIVDINDVCRAQREFIDADSESEEACSICYHYPSFSTGGCESICVSSSRGWLESTTPFCMCGCSIVESFESASLNSLEIGSSGIHTETFAESFEEFVDQIEESAVAASDYGNAQDSEPVAASSGSLNGSTSGMQETPAVDIQSNERDGEGQTLDIIEPTRPLRVPPIGLDEYKRKAILEIEEVLNSKSNAARLQVRHRLEPGGGAYNYAAATQGAKVMASNKEAKGASNILEKDRDKYMRNPCNAEKKFVIVELSEETLVDTVAIANYEFYSSNLKDLELLGSLNFPTDGWVPLGKFEAENARHLLNFKLNEPKWVRYLRLNMLSHHGSEFFCTLSTLEVYGEDAIERLLEDWRGEEEQTRSRVRSTSTTLLTDEKPGGGTSTGEAVQMENEPSYSVTKESNQDLSSGEQLKQSSSGTDATSTFAGLSTPLKGQLDSLDDSGKSSTTENIASVRPPGDSILKILMQKVKSLELNQSLFDRYLEEMNMKYSDMFNDLDQELRVLNEHLRNQTVSVGNLAKRLYELNVTFEFEKRALESTFAVQLVTYHSELETLRSRIDRAEKREIVALSLALLIMTVSGLLYSVYRCLFFVGLNSSKNNKISYGGALMGIFVASGVIPLILSV